MQRTALLTKIFTVVVVLSTLISLCTCEAEVEERELSHGDVTVEPKTWRAVHQEASVGTSRARSDDLSQFESSEISSEARQHGIKIKKKKPKLKLKKSKKFLKKFLPFLLIPLLIQAKLIPLFLFKLKLIALKAFGIGKLALILIIINVIYNAMHGAQDKDQQYNQEVLADEHYGYNGGQEYGAWINRRYFNAQKP